jgi:hypothetical protein
LFFVPLDFRAWLWYNKNMVQFLNKSRVLNGNIIKLIAVVAMVFDHAGFLFFPYETWMRAIGRIAMPLFAFFLAEGCRYTRNKFRHFAMLFLLAFVCQVVDYIAEGRLYLTILFTFSISVLLIYSLQYFKKKLFDAEAKLFDKILSGLLFCALVAGVWFVNAIKRINGNPFAIDYGFWGCMLPVFASLFDFRGIDLPEKARFLDGYYLKVGAFAVGLLLTCLFPTSRLNHWYSFLALAPLLLYNGRRGKYNLKYFFYVFYPAHLVLLYLISLWV